MLRNLGALLCKAERSSSSPFFAAFSSNVDYSLVLQKASEVAKESAVPIPDKEVGLCAGVPLETFTRKARICTPARCASQQGTGRTLANKNAPAWRIEFDSTAKWTNPLMGWTSSADPLENVARTSLAFYTKEEAMAFCNKHGWGYEVDEPNVRRTQRSKRYMGYGDNFSIKRKGVPDLSTLRSNQQAPASQ